jgi:N-acetylglutamate synthase-like GNAT family acetyltransferase
MLMTAATHFQTRRATVDDLPQLISLWQLEQLPADVLEKRFTEFQVVSDDAGQVLAAIGIQISGVHGLLHSESIAKPELGDKLRELLWNRLQVMIHNHALEKLWTENSVSFWRDIGFELASPEHMAAMPAAFKNESRGWRVKTLRAADASAAIDRELAQLKTLQQEESARMASRVQWMKRLAFGMTIVVFLLVVVWAIVMLKYGPQLRK